MAKRIIELALCTALIAGLGGAALAQGGAEAITKRQAIMKTLLPGGNAATAAAAAGDFDTAVAKAKEVSANAHAMAGLFPAGSGAEAGVRTRAKAEIWSDATGFKAAMDKFVAATDEIAAGAAAKDAARVDSAVKNLATTCGSCHTAYRGPAGG